jgi:predicted SnoaL-like aldol condensation-catalyzing enzyme
MRIRYAAAVALATIFAGVLASAQDPVKPASNIESLFRDNNKRLNDMKQVAYHIEKDLLQCNHWDEAASWLTERYIQHNPLVASGRAPVVKHFGTRPRTAVCETLNTPVVAVLADGNLVTVVRVADLKDSKGVAYTTTWFDMWRIVNGKGDEHWDPTVKP